ncbi:eCIS core domain-containing protein [Paucibacter sp. M5-1]|uniref:eCIS core domain-containing protein n=1 Tax=Paucibacter sp. M5-1 TaxID=3015998 RepID=UPI0022B8DF1B|nr:DUF4157 domain-containing protein [Paucibacter sp. M5-1]MCZ7882890.1 DUF4157 domain-containing protein [Paucibacter sp. M5-1]
MDHPQALSGPAAPSSSPRQQAQQTQISQLRGAAQQGRADGLPPSLQQGIEALSGVDMSDVRVHRNSGKPAQLSALAYAQGKDIHLAPGQDANLAHEAWHVVQQRQQRVKPTTEIGGQAVNDSPALEREADRMGAQASRQGAKATPGQGGVQLKKEPGGLIRQLVRQYKKGSGQGGRGGGGKPQIHKRHKPEDERQRREAIGRHHARTHPVAPPRRRGGAQGPGQAPHHQPPQHQGPPPQGQPGGGQAPPVVVHNPPPHVAIDIGEEDAQPPQGQRQPGGWAGVGRRIGKKATRGRTFGDTANMVGTMGGLLSDVSSIASGTMTAIGGAGVAINGLTLLVNGLKEHGRAGTAAERREAMYGVASGVFNLASGVYGLVAGISALADASKLSTVSGLISAGAWALSEATNVVAQLDTIMQIKSEDKPLRAYLKPLASMLASLLKCTGSAVALYAGLAKALGDENKDAGMAANVLMMLGIAISVIHGIIKLIMICKKELGNPQPGQDHEDGGGPGHDAFDLGNIV